MTRLQRLLRRLWPEREGAYVAQIQGWAHADPVIPPLPLPAIKPLVAVPAARRGDRIRQFPRRAEGR